MANIVPTSKIYSMREELEHIKHAPDTNFDYRYDVFPTRNLVGRHIFAFQTNLPYTHIAHTYDLVYQVKETAYFKAYFFRNEYSFPSPLELHIDYWGSPVFLFKATVDQVLQRIRENCAATRERWPLGYYDAVLIGASL